MEPNWLEKEKARKYHPASMLFPLLEGEEFEQLKADIKEYGLLEPITLHQDESILDGRNRHRACVALKKESKFETWKDNGSPISFVVSKNLCRRHLTYDQRVGLALKLEPALAEEARKRQATHQVGNVYLVPNSAQAVGRAAEEAASTAGVGKSAVVEMKAVQKEQHDLADRLITGQTTVREERKEKLQRKRKKERMAMAQAAQDIQPSDRWQIFRDDLTTWIAPRKYDFIITDPPYPKEYLPFYETLALRAKDWLQPGGLLVAMCGQSYLDEIMTMMIKHLDYYWTAAYLTPGQPTPLRQRQVNTSWKPLLIFTLKGDTYKGKIFGDVFVSAKPEKDAHDWGQSISGMSAVIKQICLPGQWILDPFCGAGSTGIAALMHGCLFHGVDIDEDNVNISRSRLGAIRDSRTKSL